MINYVRQFPITSFILLNYAISWSFLYPCYQMILNAEEGSFPPLALIGLIGAYGPSIAAIIVEQICNGKAGVRTLLKKLLIGKVSVVWYLFLLLPIIIYAMALLLSVFFGFEAATFDFKEAATMALPYIALALPFGPMGEELGWRGYMLPKLLEKYNLVISSLIIGVAWTVWHLASFSFPGAAIPSIFEVNAKTLFWYLLTITSSSFLFSYLWVQSRGSVLLAILLHATFNASTNIVLAAFPEVAENVSQREWIYVANFVITFIVVGLIWYFKPPEKR